MLLSEGVVSTRAQQASNEAVQRTAPPPRAVQAVLQDADAGLLSPMSMNCVIMKIATCSVMSLAARAAGTSLTTFPAAGQVSETGFRSRKSFPPSDAAHDRGVPQWNLEDLAVVVP